MSSIKEYIMNQKLEITSISDACKNALKHYNLDKHKNIKSSTVKKLNIVIDPRELLNNLCFIQEDTNNILLDYRYFKCFVAYEDYDNIFGYFNNLIAKVLQKNEDFNVHIYMHSVSITDIDKFTSFISKLSQVMKDSYQGKLGNCYIYNASFIFTQVVKIISKFFDKDTQDRIKLIDE
jgi:hypothetical protein